MTKKYMDGLTCTLVGGLCFWLFGSATNYYSPKLLHVTSLKFRVMLVSNNRQRERKILFGWRKGSDVNDTESLTIDHNCRKDLNQTTSLIHTIYILFSTNHSPPGIDCFFLYCTVTYTWYEAIKIQPDLIYESGTDCTDTGGKK